VDSVALPIGPGGPDLRFLGIFFFGFCLRCLRTQAIRSYAETAPMRAVAERRLATAAK
jgi:hypothetical protein